MAKITIKNGPEFLPQYLEMTDEPLYHGGKARLYLTTDDQYVVKIYHRPSAEEERRQQVVVDLGRTWWGRRSPPIWAWAWPLAVVVEMDGKPTMGVVSRRVPRSYVRLTDLIYNLERVNEQFKQGSTWADYLRVARQVAEAVAALHGKGIAVIDLSSRNLLANLPLGQVMLVDLDSVAVKGFLHPQVLGTPGFIAPEVLQGLAAPGVVSDRHALAVLILWILLFRNVMEPLQCYSDDPAEDDRLGWGKYACFSENPHDHRNWHRRIGTPYFRGGLLSYKCLSPRLQELVERSLIEGLHRPSRRPPAQAWLQALTEAEDLLVKCTDCSQPYIYPFWQQPPRLRLCPFCGHGTAIRRPVLAELLRARGEKYFVPVRAIALDAGEICSFDLHCAGKTTTASGLDAEVAGKVVWDSSLSNYRLLNVGRLTWDALAGERRTIEPGEGVAIRQGLVLGLGDGERLLRVVEDVIETAPDTEWEPVREYGLRRLPLYFLVDTSSSSQSATAESPSARLERLLHNVKGDPFARESVYVAVITFDTKASMITDGLVAFRDFQVPDLPIADSTVKRLDLAMEVLEVSLDTDVRRRVGTGVKGDYRPMVCILLDGEATDENGAPSRRWEEFLRKMAKRPAGLVKPVWIARFESDLGLWLFDMDKEAYRECGELLQMFQWITQSLSSQWIIP